MKLLLIYIELWNNTNFSEEAVERKVCMPKREDKDRGAKEFAAGDYDLLEQNATREEKKKGDYTKVTRLALDEVDPS